MTAVKVNISVSQFPMKNLYSDFDVEFNLNRKTKDVNIKRDADSIKQSIWNLLQTNFYDRKWHPEIGSYFPKIMFSLDHPEMLHIIQDQIATLLKNYEPRIAVGSVNVYHADQMAQDRGEVTVEINYSNLELGNETAIFHLERTR